MKKIALILCVMVNLFLVCLPIKVDAYRSPDLVLSVNPETTLEYFTDKPESHYTNPTNNLKVTYEESSNTYVFTVSGDVTLEPYGMPAIVTSVCNIKIVGEGKLTVNYTADNSEPAPPENMLVIYPSSIIYCVNERPQSENDLLTLTIGTPKQDKDVKNTLSLELNAFKNEEILRSNNLESAINFNALCGDIVILNGVDISASCDYGAIAASNKIIATDSNIEVSHADVIGSRDICACNSNNFISFDNSTLTMNISEEDNAYGLAFYTTDLEIVNGSYIDVTTPCSLDEEAAVLYCGGNVLIKDSDCHASGLLAGVACRNLTIENSNVDFVGETAGAIISPDEIKDGIVIKQDAGYYMNFEYKNSKEAFGIIWFNDDRTIEKYNIDETYGEGVVLCAGTDEDDQLEYKSIMEVLKSGNKCAYIKIEKTYTVKFFDEATEYTDLRLVISPNGKIEKPKDPTKDGYEFLGFYSDKECTAPFDFDKTITNDTVIYIKWKKIEEKKEEEQGNTNNSSYIIPKTGIK